MPLGKSINPSCRYYLDNNNKNNLITIIKLTRSADGKRNWLFIINIYYKWIQLQWNKTLAVACGLPNWTKLYGNAQRSHRLLLPMACAYRPTDRPCCYWWWWLCRVVIGTCVINTHLSVCGWYEMGEIEGSQQQIMSWVIIMVMALL